MNPIIALSVLEAVRSSDGTHDETVSATDIQSEAVKLGRTRTVGAQIERYQVLAKSNGDVTYEEIGALFTLVARRPDAALLFVDAGRRAGRHAARRTPRGLRALHRTLRGRWRDRVGRYLVGRAAADVFDIEVAPGGHSASAAAECAATRSPGGHACGLFGAGIAELLRGFTSFDGACFLTACRARGGDGCRWSTIKETED